MQFRRESSGRASLANLQLLDSAAPLELSAAKVAPLTNTWLADLGIEGLKASLSQSFQHEEMERNVRLLCCQQLPVNKNAAGRQPPL